MFYIIYWILDFAEEFDRCLFFTVKKIFLYNVLAQLENTVPDNTIYQLKNWQYRTTAKDIHIKTGISEATLSNMRSNSTTRYDAKTLDLLCKYFNCKVSDLLEFTPD